MGALLRVSLSVTILDQKAARYLGAGASFFFFNEKKNFSKEGPPSFFFNARQEQTPSARALLATRARLPKHYKDAVSRY